MFEYMTEEQIYEEMVKDDEKLAEWYPEPDFDDITKDNVHEWNEYYDKIIYHTKLTYNGLIPIPNFLTTVTSVGIGLPKNINFKAMRAIVEHKAAVLDCLNCEVRKRRTEASFKICQKGKVERNRVEWEAKKAEIAAKYGTPDLDNLTPENVSSAKEYYEAILHWAYVYWFDYTRVNFDSTSIYDILGEKPDSFETKKMEVRLLASQVKQLNSHLEEFCQNGNKKFIY